MTARLHHSTHDTPSRNKHKDPLKLYDAFPDGKRYRLWFTGVSESSYVEVAENKGAGTDQKTGKNYTFVECKLLHLDENETNGAREGDPEVGYIIAYEIKTGIYGAQSQNYFFTRSLKQTPFEIIMATEVNKETITTGYAPQVKEILAKIGTKH